MSLSKNLRYLRKKNDYSQEYISDLLGYKSYTTIQKWEMGLSEPSLAKLAQLSDLYKVDLDRLMKTDLEYAELNPSLKSKGVKIPVLGKVAAGVPIEAVEEIIDYEEITEELAKTGDFFCLEISGDSMSPRMVEKDVVVVRKQEDIESGEIAVVCVNGVDATVKKVVKHENGISLISINQAYPPRFFTCDEIKTLPVGIIGKVVELRGKF